jgi:hypothetical protein
MLHRRLAARRARLPDFSVPQPAGQSARRRLGGSLQNRSRFLIEVIAAVREVAAMPVMVTGGFRSTAGMVDALDGGDLDVVGVGRPLITDREAARRLLAGEVDQLPTPTLHVLHIQPWHNMQLERLGDGLEPDLGLTGDAAACAFVELEAAKTAALLEHRARLRRGDAA